MSNLYFNLNFTIVDQFWSSTASLYYEPALSHKCIQLFICNLPLENSQMKKIKIVFGLHACIFYFLYVSATMTKSD